MSSKLFTSSSSNSHNSIDILTFDPQVEKNLLSNLKHSLDDILIDKDELYQNYVNLKFHEFDAISLFMVEDRIHGFCTLWNRQFYPCNTARIFSRWFEGQILRKNTNTVFGSHTLAVLEHQIEFAKQKGYEWVFVSREKNPKVLERMSLEMTQQTPYKFIFHNKKIPVCSPKEDSCWQWVIYCNLNGDESARWDMLQ